MHPNTLSASLTTLLLCQSSGLAQSGGGPYSSSNLTPSNSAPSNSAPSNSATPLSLLPFGTAPTSFRAHQHANLNIHGLMALPPNSAHTESIQPYTLSSTEANTMSKSENEQIQSSIKQMPEKFQTLMTKLAKDLLPAAKQEGVSIQGMMDALTRWCEPHRHYHGPMHLSTLMENISQCPELKGSERDALLITALFHDVVYTISATPPEQSNEQSSLDLYQQSLENGKPSNPIVESAILATEDRNPPADQAENRLSRLFWSMDNAILYSSSLAEKVTWGEQIKAEYEPIFGETAYQAGRMQFLEQVKSVTSLEMMSLYTSDPAEQASRLSDFQQQIDLLIEALKI